MWLTESFDARFSEDIGPPIASNEARGLNFFTGQPSTYSSAKLAATKERMVNQLHRAKREAEKQRCGPQITSIVARGLDGTIGQPVTSSGVRGIEGELS